MTINSAVADPDLELRKRGGGCGFFLESVRPKKFLEVCIFFLDQNEGGGAGSPGPLP